MTEPEVLALFLPRTISHSEAMAELWGVIRDRMPFPCEFSWSGSADIDVSLRASTRQDTGQATRQPIVVRFDQRGLAYYRNGSDVTRQRARESVGHAVARMVRAYNLGLQSSKDVAVPFVIECDLRASATANA